MNSFGSKSAVVKWPLRTRMTATTNRTNLRLEVKQMATISEVARLLGVDRDTVKKWTTEFAEHLSLTANPSKGKERQFGEADLRVLALVADFWEDDPDLENIHAMLNSGEFNEEHFAEFARLHTPLFQEMPGAIRLWRVKSAFWGVFRETPARELAG